MAALFALTTLIGMLTLVFKIRKHLKNPFEERHDDLSPHDSGNVIEGEYKVLEEKNKD